MNNKDLEDIDQFFFGSTGTENDNAFSFENLLKDVGRPIDTTVKDFLPFEMMESSITTHDEGQPVQQNFQSESRVQITESKRTGTYPSPFNSEKLLGSVKNPVISDLLRNVRVVQEQRKSHKRGTSQDDQLSSGGK
jgi:hypothetical protein